MKTSVLTLCAVIGCGLMAGLFFAFSVCVMKALGQLPPREGIAAMQKINVVILNPLFLAVFMGTSALCAWALVWSLRNSGVAGARCLLAASVCYLVGVLLVTIAFNVPMNDALASTQPQSPEAAQLWADYLTNWTMWNHVRTAASIAATALLALGLGHSARP